MNIALVNKSTVVSKADFALICGAVQIQLRSHVAPHWDRVAPNVQSFADTATVPPDFKALVIFDNADQQGVLGYHDETPQGVEYGKVFAKTVVQYGGDILTKLLSVSATTSHEACELFVDPTCRDWSDNAGRREVAKELCDPVEDQAYDILVGQNEVKVSNFVFPAYFDVNDHSGHYDYLTKLTQPLSHSAGGYLIVRSAGAESTVNAEVLASPHTYPEWKRDVKLSPASRTLRRIA